MARSLFQKPRGTGFQGRLYSDFEEDEYPRRRNIDFEQRVSRKPHRILTAIYYAVCVAVGLTTGVVLWLFGAALRG